MGAPCSPQVECLELRRNRAKILNEKYKIINTASTGTAAININGVTIHNLLRLFQDEKNATKI